MFRMKLKSLSVIQNNKMYFLFIFGFAWCECSFSICTNISCGARQDGGFRDICAVTVVHNQRLIDGVSEVHVH